MSGGPAAPGGEGGSGGGIYSDSIGISNVLRNTLVALNSVNVGGLPGTNNGNGFLPGNPSIGNPGTNGVGPDVAGDFTSQKFNLIGMADGSLGLTNGVNADQAGTVAAPVEPLLGPLQMNGGPTPTHALLTGSPAIDQGNSFGVHTDQRGLKRPYNFPNISNPAGGDGGDIGAFELQPAL